MNIVVRRLWTVLWAAILALLVAGFASLVWGALLIGNLTISPTIPWSLVVMAAVLWLMWQYLGGRWPLQRTAEFRRTHLRANLVSLRVFGWAWLAGGLALAGLVGLWIVLVELTKVGGNPTIPTQSGVPLYAVVLALVMGSLVSSITEEFAFRGYAQVTLERVFGGVVAVAISSLFFALYHGPTQGFAWSKLLFYYLVGVVFGTIAVLTRSILPALPVHLAGDLIFFFLIWPYDATRRYIWRDGADIWFWLCMALAIVGAALAILAFWQLARSISANKPLLQPAIAQIVPDATPN